MFGRILSWVIGVALTALYASAVISAVGNLVLLPEMAASMGLGISAVGWFWLGLLVALPIVVFGVALLFGRRRSAAVRLLLLATGVCVVSAAQLEIGLLVPQQSFFA